MDRLLKIEEVSERLRVPRATLYFWRNEGSGPRAALIGRRLMYKESEVTAWLDAQFDQAPV